MADHNKTSPCRDRKRPGRQNSTLQNKYAFKKTDQPPDQHDASRNDHDRIELKSIIVEESLRHYDEQVHTTDYSELRGSQFLAASAICSCLQRDELQYQTSAAGPKHN